MSAFIQLRSLAPRRTPPPASLRRAAAIHALAGRLIARYARSAVQRRSPALQVLRSPVWFVSNLSTHHRVSLSTHNHACATRNESPSPMREWRREVTRVLMLPLRAEPAPLAFVRPAAPATRVPALTRLLQRQVRVDTGSGPARPARELSTTLHREPMPPRRPARAALGPVRPRELPVVRRTPPRDSVANYASDAARVPTLPAPGPAAPLRTAAAPLAQHEHELERIAERVIGSIDRRLVAQRERFGRP